MAENTGYEGYQGYGGYGQAMDPASMRARLAMAMLERGSDSSPIRSPWQGAARMSNALFGALMMRQMQQSQTDSWQKALAGMPTGGGLAPGGAPGGSPGLPAQPGALSDLTNDPDITRGVANAATNGLPDSATIGSSLQRGPSPPQMGPPMPSMAPNNAAGGMPPGYIGGGGGPGSMAPNMTAALPASMQHNMMVAGPGAPSQVPPLPPSGPASGNGPQGAGAGFNPQDLAMLQQDMQAVPGTPAVGSGAGGGGHMNYGGQIDVPTAYHLALNAGFQPGQQAAQAAAIAMGESSGNPMAKNASNKNGSVDYGLMQINSSHPELNPSSLMGDPQGSMNAAYSLFKKRGNFGDFVSTNGQNGNYNSALPKAMAYAGATGGGGGGQNAPAVEAIQGAAGPPGGGPAPNNMFAQDMRGVPGGPSGPQGQVPGSMQPNMMVAGPGVPSGARGGAPPPMPPPGAMGPPPSGGGNPFSAIGSGLQNMFGLANPSGPQGGNGPAPAGGGAGGQAVDPRMKALMEVISDPYAAPGAKQVAMQFLQYYMPHPMEWREVKGTNDQQGFNPMTGQPVPGAILHGGPQRFNEAPGATEYTLPSSGQGPATAIAGYGARPAGGGGAGAPAGAGSPGPSNTPQPGEPYEAFKARMEKQGGNEGALAVPSTEDYTKITQGARGDESYKEADLSTNAYNGMTRASTLDTHAADKTMIDSFNQIMNPNTRSGVGMFNINQDLQSFPDELRGEIAKAWNGQGKLSPQTRAAMLTDSRIRVEAYRSSWDAARGGWLQTAKHGNVDPSAVPNLIQPLEPDWGSISRYIVDAKGNITDSRAAGAQVPHSTLETIPGQPQPNAAQAAPVPSGFAHQGTAGGPVVIQSDDDYNRLPSGAKFIGPDGKTRAKP